MRFLRLIGMLFFSFSLYSSEFTPEMCIFDSKEDLGWSCARKIANLILQNQQLGEKTVLGLATGSTPLPVYSAFREIVQNEKIDLSKVITFNLDEYLGLENTHPQSYHYFMNEYLFDGLMFSDEHPYGFRQENIFIPDGYAKVEENLSQDEVLALFEHFPEREEGNPLSKAEEIWILNERAKKYDALIKELGPIDLQILGVGANGHIGFAEPGSALNGITSVVQLSEITRGDNSRFFDNKFDEVPEYAISMGIGTIIQAKEIVLLATGKNKARIVKKTMEDPISSCIPSTSIRMHPNSHIWMDREAASCGEKVTKFYNAHILKNHEIQRGELWICGNKIIEPQLLFDSEVNVGGLILAPGYIDLQLNGGFGYDFSSTPEKVSEVAGLITQYGVTSFLPTIISTRQGSYSKLIPHLQPIQGGASGASILGVHLEGPFLNPKHHAAHYPQNIQPFNQSLEEFYGTLEGVKLITLAPELPGALEAIQFLKEKNIVISAGHSSASFEEMEWAISHGVSLATHLFNAMTPFHHRSPGMTIAALTKDRFFYTLIAESQHLHPSTAKLAWRANPKGAVIITDAMAALGLSPGRYTLGDLEVDVVNEAAYIAGTDILAGSVVPMDAKVRWFYQNTGCSLVDAIETASLQPARVLGIEKNKGNLNPGGDADFIFLDNELNVQAVYVLGELTYCSK